MAAKAFFKSAIFLAMAGAAIAQPAPSTFQTTSISVGCNPLKVVSGDFNGDHTPDLAFACTATSANRIMIMLGNGDGTFGAPIPVVAAPIAVAAANRFFAADLDRDGKSDLLYVDAGGNFVVLLSAGDGTFRSVTTGPQNPNLLLTAVADLNGDGIP